MWKCACVQGGRAFAPLLVAALGCGIPSVEEGLSNLQSWKDFSPIQPTATVQSDIPADECDGGTVDAGVCVQLQLIEDVRYACTTTRYSLTDTPEKIVMYSPDAELLWPGALIQGRSHRNGTGGLLPLPIKERAPIKVSIPALAVEDNFRVIENPDQAVVMQQVGSMIAGATKSEVIAPSTITFDMQTFESEQAFSLKAGMSAKYLGFRASASGSVACDASEKTVAVQLYQKMFEVVVEPPERPQDFFSADFTPEKLQEQEQLGRIDGTQNVPVYLSNIVYGRMMMFSVTSKQSLSDIKAALSAAYHGLLFSGSVELEAQYKKTLAESEIRVSSMGGNAAATEAVIASGDWRQYFSEAPPLTSAAPLSYTFRSISDNSIASVSESTTYDLRECKPAGAADDEIVASFEGGDEGWKAPGGSNPILQFDKTDYNTVVNAYVGAHDEGADVFYFTAPITGFLEFVDRSFSGGTLSFWYRAETTVTGTPPMITADDLVLVGRNGITLSARNVFSPQIWTYREANKPGRSASPWQRVEFPLTAASWRVGRCAPVTTCTLPAATADQMTSVLDDVVDLSIRGEFVTGEDWGYLDEVTLRKPAGG